MLSVIEGILIFIIVWESILGILGNGFIGLVNCIDCVKQKKFSTIGVILTGLATSRICLIWIVLADGFMKIFALDIYTSSDFAYCVSYLWAIFVQSSTWFATSLNIFYFLKIANFSHPCFLWLKGGLNRVLPLFMGVLLISWLLSFPQITKIINDHRSLKRNRTSLFSMNKSEFFITEVFLYLGVLFFFALSLITCFLLIISLWRHSRRMQVNVTRPRDSSTEAHIRAMKVLMSFIILFILHFIGIAIEISYYIITENRLLLIFGMTLTFMYPWGHSFILILGNGKLKKASLRVLKQFKCCKKGKKSRHSMDRFGEK